MASTPDASAAPSPPKGPWSGKSLHFWTTACQVSSPEVADVVARAARAPRVVRSVGVASTAITREGSLSTLAEQPVGLGRREVAARMHELGLQTWLVVSNVGPNGFDGPLAVDLLANKTRRRALAERIAHVASNEGFDGVELDLEMMPKAAATNYAALTREVHELLHGRLLLAVDVHPKTVDDPGWDGPAAHDYTALAATGAVLRLMTYDLSVGPVPAGPSTKASWIREVVAYARAKGVPAEQLEIGLPAYGYDFPPKGTPSALRYDEVTALREKTKAELLRDEAGVPHFSYDAGSGGHEVWFDDALSLGRLLTDIGDLAAEVRGVAVWGVGLSDPNLGKCLVDQGFAVAAAALR